MRKRCERCGCYLDPGEWCDCDEYDQPEQEMARRPAARKQTIPPREYNSESYLCKRWLEFYLR